MTFTYDPTTDVGKVRMVLPDKVQANAFFTDEELEVFLEIESNWRRATALALETMAVDAALVLQVIRVQNITTDGAKVADALLKRAVQLRKQADEADASDEGGFEVTEFILDNFGRRERLLNDAIRRH